MEDINDLRSAFMRCVADERHIENRLDELENEQARLIYDWGVVHEQKNVINRKIREVDKRIY